MRAILWILVNAAALAVATGLLSGITVEGEGAERFWTLLLVALVFGVINSIIAPVLKILSLPFIILTLGLLLVVINAAMLMLTSWVCDKLGIGFEVDQFWWTAIWGAVIISLVTTVLEVVLPEN
ncbi:MAG: phage holin family protein [Nocardioidaceae bacterium]|nr:MAG: phage holin family protein [Nocardioidaceae bacterium]